jgi:hypothetical protein
MTAEDVADFFSTTPVKISRNPKLHERQRLQLTPLARNGFRLLSAACAPVDCAGRVVVLVDADVDPEGVQEVEHVLVRGQVVVFLGAFDGFSELFADVLERGFAARP